MNRAAYLREVSILRLPAKDVSNNIDYRITLHLMVEDYCGFSKDSQSITLTVPDSPRTPSPLITLVKLLESGELNGYFTAWSGREDELARQIVFCCGRGVRGCLSVELNNRGL